MQPDSTLWIVTLAMVLAACGDKGPDSNESATPGNAQSALPSNALVAPATAPDDSSAPMISVSLRGVADETIEQGEPLRIAVRLSAPRTSEQVIELAPATGSWVDAISVELIPAAGGGAAATASAIGVPERNGATLDTTRIAGGLWHMSAKQLQAVAPGHYQLHARIRIQDGNGWTGEAVAPELPIEIVPASDAPDRVAQRAINLAQEALLADQPESAARLLDAVLEKTPDDVRVLTLRGNIAERAGNPLAAMICVNRAQQARSGTATDLPPLELHDLQTRVMAALLAADDKENSVPPAWTWPPAAVLTPKPEYRVAAEGSAPSATENSSTTEPPPSTTPSATAADVRPSVDTESPAEQRGTTTSAVVSATTHIGSVVPPAELDESKILADPQGQWASGARAGTEYGSGTYGAIQMIGAPDVPGMGGDNGNAWAHSSASVGLEWIELDYARPVHATEVRIRQTNVPGTIVKVEAIDTDGSAHTWWEGVDPYPLADDIDLAWFAVQVPATTYRVAKIKVTLNMAAIPGWKEIDAVQLVGTPP